MCSCSQHDVLPPARQGIVLSRIAIGGQRLQRTVRSVAGAGHRCTTGLTARVFHGLGRGLLPLRPRRESPLQLCKVELRVTGDVQRRLPCVKSIALTTVMPTSIRMAASKTKTIKGVLLVLLNGEQVCRQALTVLLISGLRLRWRREKSPHQDTS